PLREVRRAARLRGDLLRRPGRARLDVGPRARLRPHRRRARRQGRPRDPAAAAAHPCRPGEEDGEGDGQGRPGARRRDGEVAARQVAGVQGVAAGAALVALATRTAVAVEDVAVSTYEIPTDEPESDGTLEWDSTTVVVVEVRAGDSAGLGYTYGPRAVSTLI